jgi:hypothetical protein
MKQSSSDFFHKHGFIGTKKITRASEGVILLAVLPLTSEFKETLAEWRDAIYPKLSFLELASNCYWKPFSEMWIEVLNFGCVDSGVIEPTKNIIKQTSLLCRSFTLSGGKFCFVKIAKDTYSFQLEFETSAEFIELKNQIENKINEVYGTRFESKIVKPIIPIAKIYLANKKEALQIKSWKELFEMNLLFLSIETVELQQVNASYGGVGFQTIASFKIGTEIGNSKAKMF